MPKGTSRAVLAAGAVAAAVFAGCVEPAVAATSPEGTGPAGVSQHSRASGQVPNHQMGTMLRHEQRGRVPRALDARSARSASGVEGVDVASYQGNVDWASQWNAGKRFAWVKATESTTYTNPYFAQQYNGAADQGFLRGAYHFASPNTSSGSAQAQFFLAHGGGWTADGKTLPGALDIEATSGVSTCYGLSPLQMSQWIQDFSDTYHAATNKYPAIYTNARWWNQCVGGGFSTTNPLWLARYADSPGTLPRDWDDYSVWQYDDEPVDQDVFNGSETQLRAFATNPD